MRRQAGSEPLGGGRPWVRSCRATPESDSRARPMERRLQWSCALRLRLRERARAVDGFPNVFPIVRVVLPRTPVETPASGRNGSAVATKRQRDELQRLLLLPDQTCVTIVSV